MYALHGGGCFLVRFAPDAAEFTTSDFDVDMVIFELSAEFTYFLQNRSCGFLKSGGGMKLPDVMSSPRGVKPRSPS